MHYFASASAPTANSFSCANLYTVHLYCLGSRVLPSFYSFRETTRFWRSSRSPECYAIRQRAQVAGCTFPRYFSKDRRTSFSEAPTLRSVNLHESTLRRVRAFRFRYRVQSIARDNEDTVIASGGKSLESLLFQPDFQYVHPPVADARAS